MSYTTYMIYSPLTDTHCHLASRQFAADADACVGRAVDAGVTRMVTIGTDLEDGPRCLELAARHSGVFAAVGIHPCSVHEITEADWLERVRAMARHPKVAALGEIGLDYFHPAPDGFTEAAYHARQADFFTAQLDLAAELGLNVIIHQRDKGARCWDDLRHLLEPYHGRLRAVFHCFTAPWEAARPMVERGHLVSFTGIVTFKTATDIHDCATKATPGSFMLETDAPYLAPVPHRGTRCEPAHTRLTAGFIAALRGTPVDVLAAETNATAEAFFRFGSSAG